MPELLSASLQLAEVGTLRGIVGVLFGVGALIFFHELGHFLAAKWAGVRVEVFSLGFGQRMVGFRRGDTDYRISWLPLGGYVRMLGQADDDPNQPRTDLACDFRNQPAFKRFVILIAGVVMNLVLAAVGFMAAFGLGIDFTAPEIGRVDPGYPASRADVQPGDIVVAVDGEEVLGWQDLTHLVAISTGELELELRRGDERIKTRVNPVRGKGDSFAQIGVQPVYVLAGFAPDSPLPAAGAQAATVEVSDRIVDVSPVGSHSASDAPLTDGALAQRIESLSGRATVTLERTRYGTDGLPTSRKRIPLEVEIPRKPEYGIGLHLSDSPYVRSLTEDGAAQAAGVLVGDRLLRLGGQDLTYENLRDVVADVGATSQGADVPLVVERPGAEGPSEIELQVAVPLQNEAQLQAALEGVEDPEAQRVVRREVGRYLLGLTYKADTVAAPSPLSAADPEHAVTLEPGARITRLWTSGGLWWSAEEEFQSAHRLRQILRARGEEPLLLGYIPAGKDKGDEETLVVQAAPIPGQTYGDLGYEVEYRRVNIQRGPVAAVGLGLHQTAVQTQRIALMLRSFATGSVSPKELGGPIQIVNVAYKVARHDSLARLFHLLAILSVNLAVINVLPIPVLDGGHILFLLLEKLKGKPVSGEVLSAAQWLGLIMILGLMALVFFNDIRRIVAQ
ncbi:MAG: site-2 protease family protein [Planctomycetota bacterium]